MKILFDYTPILVAALHAGVDYLVTFDGDLLTMDSYEGIDIVTAGRLLTDINAAIGFACVA